jgi:hypothetical protein
MARWIMILGAVLLALGALMHFAPGALNWFGKGPQRFYGACCRI